MVHLCLKRFSDMAPIMQILNVLDFPYGPDCVKIEVFKDDDAHSSERKSATYKLSQPDFDTLLEMYQSLIQLWGSRKLEQNGQALSNCANELRQYYEEDLAGHKFLGLQTLLDSIQD